MVHCGRKKIGFPTEKDKDIYLTPLLEKLKELKKDLSIN